LFAITRARCSYLYDWADQWVLADAETVKVKGTPVIVLENMILKRQNHGCNY
jgi:hypothetical protein